VASNFFRNSAASGGAIYADGGILLVHTGVFRRNTAGAGGAVWNNSPSRLDNTTFTGNNGGSYGGAIYNQAVLTVATVTADGNSATYGGAIDNQDVLALTGGSISGNSAMFGGGLHNFFRVTAGTTTFEQNTASSQGGGIDNNAGATASLQFSRVIYNHAPGGEGGGIYNGGTVNLTGTTVMWNFINNCSPAASVPGCIG